MSGSVNKILIIGNLAKDPEIRSTQDGREIANLTVATNESWTDKNTGAKKERVEWHKVCIFNPGLVKVVKAYLSKGSKVYVEGQLQTRKWQDKEGADRYTTEIVVQGFNSAITSLDRAAKQEAETTPTSYAAATGGEFVSEEMLDDIIPF